MKFYYSYFISFIFITFITVTAYSQVAINTDGAVPDGSSMLDITSTSRGMLIPRMLETERTSIASPVQGLMVYQTDNTEGFYYYNGSSWLYIGNEANNLWTRQGTNTYLTNTSDSVGIGTVSPNMELSVAGDATARNYFSVIPLWQSGSVYDVTNTTLQDLSNCDSGIEPSVYESNGNIEVKLVIRLTEANGNGNEFQLKAQYWNGSSVVSVIPVSNSDSWTWGQTNGTPYRAVVTSEWKTWSAGTNAWEIHLNGKKSSDGGGSLKFNSAYLLVRPAQP
ncbi:MAG: hypothetical protein K8R54_11830 [Bacteroidales bacterium]|nr:hypothetical protein [Bacteroidales bacterium]